MSCKTSGRNGEVDRVMAALGRSLTHSQFTRIRKMADRPESAQCLAEPHLNRNIRTMLFTTVVQFYTGTEGMSQREAEEKAAYILAPVPGAVTDDGYGGGYGYGFGYGYELADSGEGVGEGKTYMDNRTMYAFYCGLGQPTTKRKQAAGTQ